MGIFKEGVTTEALNKLCRNTLAEQIGIEITSIGPDFLEGKLPVDDRTRQPFGLLHGGASVVLAETLGSIAASCCLDPTKQFCVGLEINANHLKSVRQGYVIGTAKPIHIGKQTHVWEIRICNDAQEMICISRLTIAVLDKKEQVTP
jgi:1,4-dihydroxy-2-naphthoyl-CoA hydrolase